MFWAFNIPDISRVIRHGLFRDASFPRSSLLSRNVDAIDAFLKTTSEPREQQLLGNLSHVQKVEEILRRSSIPALEPVLWSWFPMPPCHSLDARSIASAIEAESYFQFTRIAFEEIVRASLGYNAPSVEWFLLQHTALYIHLLEHLHTYPEEIPLYIEVGKVSFGLCIALMLPYSFSLAPTNSKSLCTPSSSALFDCITARCHSRSQTAV